MDFLRLRNIRSLADTGDIRLKPITFLVGQNSSGKSTFLRTLPLLKQSLENRSSAPVLWFGNYVDFGSVEDVKSRTSGKDAVSIEIGMPVYAMSRAFALYVGDVPFDGVNEISVRIDLQEIEKKTQLSSMSISIEGDSVYAEVDSDGSIKSLTVNGHDYKKYFPKETFAISRTDLIPQFIIKEDRPISPVRFRARRSLRLIDHDIRDFYHGHFHQNMNTGTATLISSRILYTPKSLFNDHLRSFSSFNKYRSWRDFIASVNSNAVNLEHVRRLHLLRAVPDMLRAFDRTLYNVLESTSYVGPARATGERYYRVQELAVDQIDPAGANLPMFLHSLERGKLSEFSSWLSKHIGYEIDPDRHEGHIQINLKEVGTDNFFNIADVGYGLSQVLPIMAQIWQHKNSPKRFSPYAIVAMEQPELHLHPAYQAKIADAVAGAVKASTETRSGQFPPTYKFVIETHSEVMINRIGELIRSGDLDSEDVAVYIFERSSTDPSTSVRTSSYDSNGFLQNWPYGFFGAY